MNQTFKPIINIFFFNWVYNATSILGLNTMYKSNSKIMSNSWNTFQVEESKKKIS